MLILIILFLLWKTQNLCSCRHFISKRNFVGVNRLFILVYPNEDGNVKRFKIRRCHFPKGIIKNYDIIINRKNFYDQAIDSDIKRYEEIGKLTTRKDVDYSTGFLLDYDFIKSHYKLTETDLSRQKELDVDPKAFKQIETVGQLKSEDAINADGAESMFILPILEEIRETGSKFSRKSVTVL